MNLKVIKSHIGQYMTPFNIVGSKSRFNRATISSPFSPGNQEKLLTIHELKIVKGGAKVLWNFVQNGNCGVNIKLRKLDIPCKRAFREKKTTVMAGP